MVFGSGVVGLSVPFPHAHSTHDCIHSISLSRPSMLPILHSVCSFLTQRPLSVLPHAWSSPSCRWFYSSSHRAVVVHLHAEGSLHEQAGDLRCYTHMGRDLVCLFLIHAQREAIHSHGCLSICVHKRSCPSSRTG